jgi:hypothetical protein
MTYSINEGTPFETERKNSISEVLLDLPNNTAQLITPKDVRDAVYTVHELSLIREASVQSSSIKYIGIDLDFIKQKIYLGKKELSGLEIMNDTLLNSDSDMFIYNNKSDSNLSLQDTKITFLAGSDNTIFPNAPYLKAKKVASPNRIDLEFVNNSGVGSDILFSSETVTVDSDLRVVGNLLVTGSFSRIESENTVFNDTIVELSAGATGTPFYDSGVIINRGNTSSVGLIWDEGNDNFNFIYTESSATNSNVVIADHADLKIRNLNITSFNPLSPKMVTVDTNGDLSYDDIPTNITSFLALTDTPGDYTGNEGKFIVVNSGATGINFIDGPSASVSEWSFEEMEIGDWDMDITQTLSVTHSLSTTEWKTVRNISVMIRNNDDNSYTPLDTQSFLFAEQAGAVMYINQTEIMLYRRTNNYYDTGDYNDTGFNRGWITFWYKKD